MTAREVEAALLARCAAAAREDFAKHPGERLASGDVVRNGWVQSLPRLRDMLTQHLHAR